MLQELFINPLSFFIGLITLLVVVTIHEYAHAWMADRLGDPTARLMGRMTLNPLVHLDPIGTLMLLLFRFGWGKPVPFDPFNLRNPRRDSALISLAGPGANLISAALISAFIRFSHLFLNEISFLTEMFLSPFVILSVMLAVFNLLPINPLDGSKILIGFLPQKHAYKTEAILNQYSLVIFLFLILPFFGSPLFNFIISPIINFILKILLPGAPLV